MGYNTDFTGELKFINPLTEDQFEYINTMFGEDCRDHHEWNATGLYYVNLELSNDNSGIVWNGSEKTSDLEQIVTVVVKEMRKKWPDFGLSGHMIAQGERSKDRWKLVIDENGYGKKEKIANVSVGDLICCPNCEHEFKLKDLK